ncbi:TonB family protein [uncultured Methylibium sp.]|uniref:TonB family protein n=1 Tax=uncultured Methylibium sp. TaxID=381093 RepID=UPI0025DEAF51|nr:TonB family protein [uncultured Methylibium sp.]
MDRDVFDRRVARDAARRLLVVLGGGVCAAAAWGQAPAPAEPASAPSERVKRDAEKPFQWILLQSDKPRRARDGTGSAGAAPAAAAARPSRPAPGSPKPAVAAEAPVPTATLPVPVAEPTPAAPAPAAVAALQPAPGAIPLPLPEPAPADTEAEADEALELLQQIPPSFPRAVMLDMRKGSVQVRFKVQADGTVAEPSVLRSTHPRLNKPVLAAVGQWRFKPVREPREAAVELGFDLD